MADEVRINDLVIANSVIEKVVSMAAEGVPGVAAVGTSSMAGFMQNVQNALGGRPAEQPIASVSADGASLELSVHVQVYYGKKFAEIANDLRKAVADAVNVQIGIDVSRVDVYVDGIVFSE